MVRVITLLAALAATTIAAIVPVSCFLAAEARLRGEVEIRRSTTRTRLRTKRDKIPLSGMRLQTVRWEAGLDNLEIGRHWMRTIRALFPNGGECFRRRENPDRSCHLRRQPSRYWLPAWRCWMVLPVSAMWMLPARCVRH